MPIATSSTRTLLLFARSVAQEGLTAVPEQPKPADTTPADLLAAARGLTPNQMMILTGVARALSVPVEIIRSNTSDLVDDAFAETMANLLTLHHALHEEALNKNAFEYVLKQCLRAQGLNADLNPAPGESSYDVAANGVRWSLKTEAAKGISRAQLKIEKFMEAGWIRGCTTSEACFDNLPLVLAHMTGYDRILVLRAFRRPSHMAYRLEEVPKDLVERCLLKASPSMFQKLREAKSYGADFYPDESTVDKRVFRMLLDSSVEKIRIWHNIDHCLHHGEWRVRLSDVSEGSAVAEGQLDLIDIGDDV